MCFVFSWLFLKDKETVASAKFIYFSGFWNTLVLIASFTWQESSKSVSVFYICISLILVIYLCLYSYSLCFFKKLYSIFNNYSTVVILRVIAISTSLLLMFWIVTIFGMFLHDNEIVISSNLYDLIPEYDSLFETIINIGEYLSGVLKTTFGLFEIGLLQLFNNTCPDNWTIFIQSFKGVTGSVILFFALSIIFNILGFGNVNMSKEGKGE